MQRLFTNLLIIAIIAEQLKPQGRDYIHMNQYLAIYQVRQMLQKLISETADADLADKLKNIDHQLNYFLDKGIDFKQVVDGIDDSIFITDNKGNVLYVNPAYTRNTGIESERVINHNIYDLIEKDKLYSGGAIPDVLSTGKPAFRIRFRNTNL